MNLPTDFVAFSKTLNRAEPERSWPEALKALWYDAKGNWLAAHDIAETLHADLGSWIHAYLHRKEGDEWNAGYWYKRANRPFPKISLEKELQQIVESIVIDKLWDH